jgi:phosphoribosyl-dephospho-CoA transferase
LSADGPGPARHDLVWLAAGWEPALALPLAKDALLAVRAWTALGRPAVACRGAGRVAGAISLGITLPPGGPLRRVAFSVRSEAVARTSPPLPLAAALPAAPASWRAPLEALGREAAAAGLEVRVYGSLAWQRLCGEPYLTAASDVDLLVPARDAAELRLALRLLRARAGHRAPRLDGEILLPGGGGVAWRELARVPGRVLVKTAHAVAIAPTRAVLGPLAEGLA